MSPKELAHSLNISFNTYKTHQKNLYNKLKVRTIRELIAKYSERGAVQSLANETKVFSRWIINKDTLGSTTKITEEIEHIDGQYFPTINISGKLVPENHSFAGGYAIPTPSTLEAMRKMKSFSFKILGDGNTYAITLPTIDTRLKGENNHYCKLISTVNSQIQTITVKISELSQIPYWGSQVPFILGNVEFFQVHAYSTNKFNLKIWDVRFI
jgi:hypothetical protein